MELIKLQDIAHPKQTKETINRIIIAQNEFIVHTDEAVVALKNELDTAQAAIDEVADTAQQTQTAVTKVAEQVEFKQDKLIPGANIQIKDNVISAIGGGSGGEGVRVISDTDGNIILGGSVYVTDDNNGNVTML